MAGFKADNGAVKTVQAGTLAVDSISRGAYTDKNERTRRVVVVSFSGACGDGRAMRDMMIPATCPVATWDKLAAAVHAELAAEQKK
jgi:hypothetical protein